MDTNSKMISKQHFKMHTIRQSFIIISLHAIFMFFFFYGFFQTKRDIRYKNVQYTTPPLYPLTLWRQPSRFSNNKCFNCSITEICVSSECQTNDIIYFNTLTTWLKDMPEWTKCRFPMNTKEIFNMGPHWFDFMECRIKELILESKYKKTRKKNDEPSQLDILDLWGINTSINNHNNNLLLLWNDNNNGTTTQNNTNYEIHKIIAILVDALRFDFVMKPNNLTSVQKTSQHHYEWDNMQFLQNLLHSQKNNSRLYQFVADAPTATTQRLKGLMTGSIPTFFEVSESFTSSDMYGDSLLEQVREFKNPTVAMGDDTWDNLFKHSLLRSYPYPSFDIQDIDGVDNGILQDVWAELNRKDWGLLILHFLGVDHVGHKHQVNHPEMRRKLIQYDHFFKDLLEYLTTHYEAPSRTFIVLFGDHGQTDDGAHGGALPDEVDSALFAFSPNIPLIQLHVLRQQLLEHIRHIFSSNIITLKEVEYEINGLFDMLTKIDNPNNRTDVYQRYRQVNLAPTLAFILNVPIPFTNVGSFIPDMIPTRQDPFQDIECLARYALMNAVQIHQYTTIYQYITGNRHIMTNEIQHAWNNITQLYNKIWQRYYWNHNSTTTFDTNQFVFLLQLIKQSYIHNSYVLEACSLAWSEFNYTALFFGILGTGLCILLNLYFIKPFVLLKCIFATLCMYMFEILILGCIILGGFSDCFSMQESTIVRFLLVSFTLVKSLNTTTNNDSLFVWLRSSSFFWALIIGIITRLAPLFDISEAIPGATPNPILINLNCFNTIISIIAVFLIITYWYNSIAAPSLTFYGNWTSLIGWPIFLWILLSICLGASFIALNLPMSLTIQRILPATCCILSTIVIIILPFIIEYFNPGRSYNQNQLLSVKPQTQDTITYTSWLLNNQSKTIQYKDHEIIQENVSKSSNNNEIQNFLPRQRFWNSLFIQRQEIFKIILFSILLTLLWPIWLLWGSNQTLPFLLTIGLIFSSYQFIRVTQLNQYSILCLICLQGFVIFYNSGHRMTFNAIPVQAGFIGLSGFKIVRSIILIFVHVYSPFILSQFLLVAVLAEKEKFNSKNNPQNILNCLNLLWSMRILGSQIGLVILRRHLMIYNIFAPKFLYDGMILFLTHILSTIICALHAYVGNNNDITLLQKESLSHIHEEKKKN